MQIANEDGRAPLAVEPVTEVPEVVNTLGAETEKNDDDIEVAQASSGTPNQTASPWIGLATWRKVVVFFAYVRDGTSEKLV